VYGATSGAIPVRIALRSAACAIGVISSALLARLLTLLLTLRLALLSGWRIRRLWGSCGLACSDGASALRRRGHRKRRAQPQHEHTCSELKSYSQGSLYIC
jgi:hypothetical protein